MSISFRRRRASPTASRRNSFRSSNGAPATFDLYGEIANRDAFVRYCFKHAADAEAFHAQFAPAAAKAIFKKAI
jgi:hypothetical protein